MLSEQKRTLFTREVVDYLKEYFKEMEEIFSGFIPSADVEQFTEEMEVSIDELMIMLVEFPNIYSVIPITGFNIGAICLGVSGNLYYGVGIDVKGQFSALNVHAEQTAVANAIQHGEIEIVKIATNEVPCNGCRQFLYELNNADKLDIILPDGSKKVLAYYLQHAVGMEDVGLKRGVISFQNHKLQLIDPTDDHVVNRALGEANRSYAPYTKYYSGVSIQTRDGEIYGGSYAENGVHKHGLSAMEAAFVNLIMCGSNFQEIERITLVQVDRKQYDYVSKMKALAFAMAPNIIVELCNTVSCE